MLRPNEPLPDYKLDPPDDEEDERCDACGKPPRKCRCDEADRYNDEHWEDWH